MKLCLLLFLSVAYDSCVSLSITSLDSTGLSLNGTTSNVQSPCSCRNRCIISQGCTAATFDSGDTELNCLLTYAVYPEHFTVDDQKKTYLLKGMRRFFKSSAEFMGGTFEDHVVACATEAAVPGYVLDRQDVDSIVRHSEFLSDALWLPLFKEGAKFRWGNTTSLLPLTRYPFENSSIGQQHDCVVLEKDGDAVIVYSKECTLNRKCLCAKTV